MPCSNCNHVAIEQVTDLTDVEVPLPDGCLTLVSHSIKMPTGSLSGLFTRSAVHFRVLSGKLVLDRSTDTMTRLSLWPAVTWALPVFQSETVH